MVMAAMALETDMVFMILAGSWFFFFSSACSFLGSALKNLRRGDCSLLCSRRRSRFSAWYCKGQYGRRLLCPALPLCPLLITQSGQSLKQLKLMTRQYDIEGEAAKTC